LNNPRHAEFCAVPHSYNEFFDISFQSHWLELLVPSDMMHSVTGNNDRVRSAPRQRNVTHSQRKHLRPLGTAKGHVLWSPKVVRCDFRHSLGVSAMLPVMFICRRSVRDEIGVRIAPAAIACQHSRSTLFDWTVLAVPIHALRAVLYHGAPGMFV